MVGCETGFDIVDVFSPTTLCSTHATPADLEHCRSEPSPQVIQVYHSTSRSTRNDPITRTVLPKHFLQIFCNDIGSFPCCEMTTFIIMGFIHNWTYELVRTRHAFDKAWNGLPMVFPHILGTTLVSLGKWASPNFT